MAILGSSYPDKRLAMRVWPASVSLTETARRDADDDALARASCYVDKRAAEEPRAGVGGPRAVPCQAQRCRAG